MANRKYTKELLENVAKECTSIRQMLQKFGLKETGGNYSSIQKRCENFGVDISHFTGQKWHESPNQQGKKTSREKYSLEEIFVKDSPVTQKVLRGYVERHQVLEYKCSNCGCDGNWQGGIISLEIDHIDGDNSNNKIENLRYLCPNCHALTETYRGKNKALKMYSA